MNTEKKIEPTIFSALLHDIGKVYFRITGENHHEAAAKKIKEILNNDKNEVFESILYVIEKHHDNIDDIIYVILSDYLSAIERENLENQKEENQNVRNIAITNPFNDEMFFSLFSLRKQFNISLYFNNLKEEEIQTLNLSKSKDENLKIFGQEIKEIFNKINNITKNKGNFIENWLELLSLIERLTAFIPSSAYKTKPTISLYDHLKMAGAIYHLIKDLDYKEAKEIKDNLKKGGFNYEKLSEEMKNKKIGKFIMLDLSGIQNFIFNVYEKKKTINFLKTRSLYLELLLFLIILNFFEKNKIPLTQILLSTAGKAELLLRDEEDEKLKEFIKKVNKSFFDKFKNTLFIAYGSMDLKIKHLFDLKEFKNDLREKVEKEISKQKAIKFKEEVIKWNKEVINNFNNFYKCEVCYNFFKKEEFIDDSKLSAKERELYNNIFNNKKVCLYCWSFLKIGEKLRRLQKNLENIKENLSFGDLLIDNLYEKEQINKVYDVFKGIIEEEFVNKIKNVKISLDYYPKDEQNKDRQENDNKNNNIPIKFSFSLHFPLKEGIIKENDKERTTYQIKTTEELAEKEEKTLPLALVTLDVDNLGKIIYENEEDKKDKKDNDGTKSPKWSKINFKSRLLNYFFSYYVPYLIKKNDEYKDYIYLIFSGGDDVLLFGRADVVLDFLIKVREEFKHLFGDKITFSSAYVLFKPKENLRNVADLAEDLLKDAKSKIKEKNVVNLNGVIISWDEILSIKNKLEPQFRDLNNYYQTKEDIVKYLKENNYFKFLEVTKRLLEISEKGESSYKGLIYLVLRELSNLIKKKSEIDFMSFVRMQYYINRNISLLNNTKEKINYSFTINYFINCDEGKLKDYIENIIRKVLSNKGISEEEKKRKIEEIAYLLYFAKFIMQSYIKSNFLETKEKLKNIIDLIKLAENLY